MDYWSELEQDPARETGPVLYSHQSHLGVWHPGLSADETQISSGREGEPNWELYHMPYALSYASVPVSATRACFWGTGSSYLCLLFRCSQYTCFCLFLVCLFQPQRGMELWITARGWCGHFCFHFTKENERTHILKRSANISPDFFSSTVKLKMKEKDAGSATANTTVT